MSSEVKRYITLQCLAKATIIIPYKARQRLGLTPVFLTVTIGAQEA